MSVEILTKEDLQPLIANQQRMVHMLEIIAESLPTKKVYTFEDICRMLCISKNQLRARPYLLPNYGVPDYPGRIRKWRVETYHAWMETSAIQREREWSAKSTRERQTIINAIAAVKNENVAHLRKVI
jgi:hypothetical protein